MRFNPQAMRNQPELLTTLTAYKADLWSAVRKWGTSLETEPQQYYELLKSINDSKRLAPSEQHPLYIVFSNQSINKSTLESVTNYLSGFFYDDSNDVLKKIEKMVDKSQPRVQILV